MYSCPSEPFAIGPNEEETEKEIDRQIFTVSIKGSFDYLFKKY